MANETLADMLDAALVERNDAHWKTVAFVTRQALAAHLKAIGDQHRRFIVSWGGYDMLTIAVSASKARYSKWLDISDVDDSLTFAKFQKTAKVRLA